MAGVRPASPPGATSGGDGGSVLSFGASASGPGVATSAAFGGVAAAPACGSSARAIVGREERRRGALLSLAVALGQVGIGIGGAVAGMAYVSYGFASNTFVGAVAIFGMAILVHKTLPEPKLKNPDVVDLGMKK